jgi:hypothetical protein
MRKRELSTLNEPNLSNKATSFWLVILALMLSACPGWSQTNVSRAVPGRYLFIIETSHPMSRRSDGVIKTVGSVLLSEMGGQIRQGDSIGAWTYSQELQTGRLPLQKWSKMEEHDVVSAILDFVKKQKYDKPPAFSSVRPALEKVIKDSALITVILISSGEETMVGTPFDDQINALYKTWREEQEKAHMPLVTVLRAKRGTIVSYSVTPSPWQVDIPAWPEPVAKTEPPVPSKALPSTASPLIFTGKKPKPTETTNSPEVIPATSANASPTISTPAPNTTNVPVEPIVSDPSPAITSPKPPTNSIPAVNIVERKVEQLSETVQHPAETAPIASNEPPVTNQTLKPETASPVIADPSSPPNPAPVEVSQNPAPPSQDVSAGVATPNNSPLSNKLVWLAGVAVLGLASVVFVVLARRPRSEPISLITRSLEREKER